LALRGILIEPAASNILPSSQDISNATYWTTIQLGAVSATSAGAPDGTSTLNIQTPNATNSTHGVKSAVLSIAAGTYTYSIYSKPAGYNFLGSNLAAPSFAQYVQAVYDVSGGSVFSTGAVTWTILSTAIQTITTNSFYRASITFVSTTTLTEVDVLSAPTGSSFTYSGNGSSLYSWGGQLETGSVATSYVQSVNAGPGSRSADVATFTQPAGCGHNTYTFDDNSTQTQTNAPGTITIPTNLNRPWIKTITGAV
jgi:hypothetical protein